MSYDLFIVDKDVPEPEWFDVCERDGEHVRTAHGHSRRRAARPRTGEAATTSYRI